MERILTNTKGENKILDLLNGFILVSLTLFIVFILSYFLERVVLSLMFPLNILLYSFLLSTTIGYRSLKEFCIKPILYIDNIEKAREEVSRIVSRNTKNLDKEHILSAAVESLTENITDSIIAPLFYAIFFGLPGAFVYRAINTIDAMIGYKNKKYEYFGKFGAKLDDIANFIPARIACLLLIIASPIYGSFKSSIRGLREVNKLSSPNSGYTMAIVANSLNITLEKIGHYKLGRGKITKEKALRAFLAVDLTVLSFLIIYTIIYILFLYKNL